jgi:uncharacterized protein
MFLNIKEMELRRVRFDETFEPGQIDFSDTGLRQAGAVRAVGSAKVLENSGGEVRIEGSFSGVMEADCDRCLAVATFPLERKFDLFYRPTPEFREGDEIKIDEGEAELGFYEGTGFELSDVIKEQVLLALPMQRICREDCQGICPVCGANRNEVACDCHETKVDERWSALRNLHPK